MNRLLFSMLIGALSVAIACGVGPDPRPVSDEEPPGGEQTAREAGEAADEQRADDSPSIIYETNRDVHRPAEPVDDEPVDDEPVDDEPVDDEPVDDEPVDDEPVDEPEENQETQPSDDEVEEPPAGGDESEDSEDADDP